MSRISTPLLCLLGATALGGCAREISTIGQEPAIVPPIASSEFQAMTTPTLPTAFVTPNNVPQLAEASLWTGERGSLLGDRRAMQRGDILTVAIEIDDSAQISNSSDRSRSGGQSFGIGALFGLPEAVQGDLPGGAGLDPAVSTSSSSNFEGDGSVRRNEQLTLRVAATVVDVLPNGILLIEGSQQVRVNYEMRELLVSGFVRPEDVTRQNEITYDKIASARISYGGVGVISDVQQPAYGQQALDLILPF